MRWPTATDVSYLRQRQGNYSQVFLGIQKGKERTDVTASLMVGQHYQIQAADVYNAADHHLTFTTPSFLANTDIQVGMTLSVGTLADPTVYGAARIIQVDATNNRIVLEENNIAFLGHLTTSEYIWVDGVYRLYRILPYMDVKNGGGIYYEEGNSTGGGAGIPGMGIAHPNTDEYDYRPVALMGSPRFAWAGENVDFYGWRSHGRATNTITHWTWNFDGGVCAGPGVGYPGSPSAPIRVSWPTAGEYIASLTVRDNSGNTNPDAYGIRYDEHTAVRPVLVYDRPGQGSNTPYTDFEVNTLSGRFGRGWEARITVYGTADKSEFPDNALIILYAEDWYNGQRRSMGGWYGQEEILFCGYIRAGSVMVDSEKSTVTFEAQTIDQWMREIGVWPANFIDSGAVPSNWHEFNNMTVEDCLWHLASLHSTLKNVTDCFFASDVGVEKALGCVDLTEASLHDQMSNQLGSCFFGTVTASRQGSVHLFKHKNMLDLVERTWFGPPVYEFTKQDWHSELTVGVERMRNSVAQVDFIGFVYDTNRQPQDCFSLAPAHQTHFGRIEKVTGVLLTGTAVGPGTPAQAENNTLAGLYLAWKNTRFPQIATHTFNNRFLEPATLDYFAVTLAPGDCVRGYNWSQKEFLCTGVSYHIDNKKGIITVEVEGAASTWGPDGVAGDYPHLPPSGPPGSNPGEFWGEWPAEPPPWYEETTDPPLLLRGDLMSFWRMEEATGQSRLDCVDGNDLRDFNNVAQIAGKIGNAAHFTRANQQYLQAADVPSLSIDGWQSFSTVFWVYMDSKPQISPIFTKNWPGLGGEYHFAYYQALDRFRFYVLTVGASTAVSANTFGSPSTGTWYMLTTWWDAVAKRVGISVNDGPVDTANIPGPGGAVGASTAPFEIGRHNDANHHWDGRIDAAGFWKCVLSPTEISYLYNGGAGREYPFT